MAIIEHKKTRLLVDTETVTWENVTGDDTGEPYVYAKFSDKTVQVFGTFSTGTLTLQGSNDPRVLTDPDNAVWSTLTDNQGNALEIAVAGIKLIAENPRFIRPSADSSITSVTVIIQAAGV